MKPKLYILPARLAPKILLPEEPNRRLQKTRLYDANGTEFVGITECSKRPDPERPTFQQVRIEMSLQPGESMVLDAPPPSLTDRLRALTDELKVDSTASRWGLHGRKCVDDDYFAALKYVVGRLEALLDSLEPQPRQEGARKENP